MGYGVSGSMGYEFKSPAYQLGGSKNVWLTREYGLSGPWVMRESTVHSLDLKFQRQISSSGSSIFCLPNPWKLRSLPYTDLNRWRLCVVAMAILDV
jgi:hypothetical protein